MKTPLDESKAPNIQGVYELNEEMNIIKKLEEKDFTDSSGKYFDYSKGKYNKQIRSVILNPHLQPSYLAYYEDNSYLNSENERKFGPFSMYFVNNQLVGLVYDGSEKERCEVLYFNYGSNFDTKIVSADVEKIKQQLSW